MRTDAVLSKALLLSTWDKYRRPGRQVQDNSVVFCADEECDECQAPFDRSTNSSLRLHQACSLESKCDFAASYTNLQRDVAAQVSTCIVQGMKRIPQDSLRSS